MTDTSRTKYLLESEVAARLRCSASKVKRLRLTGQIGYQMGRPVLISEDDLDAYIHSVTIEAAMKEAAQAAKAWEKQQKKKRQVEPLSLDQIVRRRWFVHQLKLRNKPNSA